MLQLWKLTSEQLNEITNEFFSSFFFQSTKKKIWNFRLPYLAIDKA